ncbi:MAG: hypothetical protein ACK5ML_10200 [Lachnospiraceae bacterium]
MKYNKKIRLFANFVIPLALGALFYYLLSPNTLFVHELDELTDHAIRQQISIENNLILKFVRNYLLDMFWAYALVMFLFLIIDHNAAGLWKSLWIAFLFSTGMEILQLLPFLKGTFDVWDILAELLAELIAILVISVFLRGEQK